MLLHVACKKFHSSSILRCIQIVSVSCTAPLPLMFVSFTLLSNVILWITYRSSCNRLILHKTMKGDWKSCLFFSPSFANLEDGITPTIANLQPSLLLSSRTWRETIATVHASLFMRNVLKQGGRQEQWKQQARIQLGMEASLIPLCQRCDSLMVCLGSLLMLKSWGWRCLLQNAWSLFQEQAILMS